MVCFYESFSLSSLPFVQVFEKTRMPGRAYVAKQKTTKFRFVIRTRVPALGFGLAGDEIHKWLRDRFGVEGYQMIPADYMGAHSVGIYLNDAAAIPELVVLLDRVEVKQGGPGSWPA